MKNLLFLILLTFMLPPFLFSQTSPEDFLGYEIGSKFTPHHRVVDYFEHVAENSPLVQYHSYGTTYEERPLTYAVISSEKNLQRISEIRKAHLTTTTSKGTNADIEDIAVVWLSYNVHGNEASGTEAAMQTLYELITSRQDILDKTVIIMDPSVNPDGRDRYVNWYKQVKSAPSDSSPQAVEHMEEWPGGRPNHYLFDLNRDWAWATQKETKERLKLYNQWLPHVHVDFHEQSPEDPYYFAPAAEPLHEVITPFQIDFQEKVGERNAAVFDQEGWLFFTKEVFDLLYPSYGDTYPTFMGSIGMTYEQGGQVGLTYRTSEGNVLSLKDRVAHHVATGLSTVQVAAENAELLTDSFHKFYNDSNSGAQNYVLRGPQDHIQALRELLDHHDIKYSRPAPRQIKGKAFRSGKNVKFESSENSLVVSTAQPKGKMVKVLFEPETLLSDSLTYDITAWSLPYAYGLDAIVTTSEIETTNLSDKEFLPNELSASATAFFSDWNSMEDARFLSDLLQNNIKVRFTQRPLENSEVNLNPGSLVITRSDNQDLPDFINLLETIANRHHQRLFPANSGLSSAGPDLGSSALKIINPPQILVLGGAGVSSLNHGEIWYYFEQELKYPVTRVRLNDFPDVDLSNTDILILPGGNYESKLDTEDLDKIKTWVRQGGKVIALGSALEYFAGKEGFDLERKAETPADSLNRKNLIPYASRERQAIKEMITGSIVETQVDTTHPLAFGYEDTYLSLKLDASAYSYLDEGFNVAVTDETPEVVAGFAGSEAQERIEETLIFGEERLGRGSIIYFVDNPLFRAFWENGKLFFSNAVFFVNNDNFTNPF